MGRRSRPRPSSRLSQRKPSRTSSEGLPVSGEYRDEAPRVLFQLLSLLVLSSLRGIFVSFCPGWLEGVWSCMAFRSQDARRGRSHVLHIFLADKSALYIPLNGR